jgi:hypothetical protein
MTTPSLPPQCLLYVDGARYADGSTGHDTDPVALDDLVVQWGRATILDQPAPASCTFRVLDLAGGPDFRTALYVGARVDVLASTVIYGDPTLPSFTDPGFESGTFGGTTTDGTAAVVTTAPHTGTKCLQVTPATGSQNVTVTIPPAPFSANPVAWDPVPRAQAGQTWQLTAWVKLPQHLAPGSQAAYVQAVAFTHPDGRAPALLLPRVPVTGPAGTWVHVVIPDVVAPTDSWLGALVTVQPTGPSWDEIPPEVTWDSLGSGLTLTNLATNPVPGSVNGWGSNNNAKWTNAYVNGVIEVVGTGVAGYVLAIRIDIPGVGTGVHVKLRHGQLIENPSGVTQPYFDGSTPDTPVLDYAWTGPADASTSTATDTRPAVSWDDLGRVYVDDVDVLAPPAGAVRQGAVFGGRITDLESAYDTTVGGTVVRVIAQSNLAELGNRYIGDTPWPAQTVAARVDAIVAAAAQPNLTATVDTGVRTRQLCYLDADARPAAGLLAEVAQSVGGALWAPTSVAAQTALRIEDVDARPALFRLVKTGGVIVIAVAPTVGTTGIELDACLLLLDPVRWAQDSTDTATQVAIGWQEQTAAGPPPTLTARTETRSNDALTAARGRFRVGISTDLATLADAATLADTMLARLSIGGWRVTGLVWQIDAGDLLDGPALSRVMQVLDGTTRIGLPILVTGLPAWSPISPETTLPMYLEGGRFSNTRGAWRLELETSSAVSQGKASVTWDQLPADWLWDQFDPAISWDDLAGVGI